MAKHDSECMLAPWSKYGHDATNSPGQSHTLQVASLLCQLVQQRDGVLRLVRATLLQPAPCVGDELEADVPSRPMSSTVTRAATRADQCGGAEYRYKL